MNWQRKFENCPHPLISCQAIWSVLRTCYACFVHAGEETYDGVPYADLVFTEVDWSETTEHIRTRSSRTNRLDEFDVEPEWASEALLDPDRLVGSGGSTSGLSVKVLGWSESAPAYKGAGLGRVLKVLVVPKDHPPTYRWWGATAMDANDKDRRRYEGDS